MAVEVIGTIKPKNGKKFPVVEAADVAMPDGNRLSDMKMGGDGMPKVEAADSGKMLQVVDGVWQLVSVADSSIKTYIDDYINEALGGDY
jgi:hypothetical protein